MTKLHFVFKCAAIAIAALLIAQYLSGYFFLWAVDRHPSDATPFTTIQYAHHYGDLLPIRRRLLAGTALGFGLVAASALVLLLPRKRSLHGDARFAHRREIAEAGLLGDKGIILGRLGHRYLMLDGQQGVALAAPPRAGKGAGVVIPNALSWPGSLVCVDIKRENWTLTAGYRHERGQRCFLFDPVAEDSARWNPLGYIPDDPRQRINQIQSIADLFFPETTGNEVFWTASARSLFIGICLYLFETPRLPRTIGEVLRQGMASAEEGFEQHWKRIVEGRRGTSWQLSPECERAIFDSIRIAPQTAGGIRKTFTSRLDLWLNPILDSATSANDFDLRNLRSQPISIYVGVNPGDLHRLRPVLNLFFQQAISLQTRELPEHNPNLRYQLMMLLDEFTALGRIPIISEAIAYLPGYNVRTVLVIQAPSQLREIYGANNAETMLKSLAARVVFAPKDFADAKEISDELGFTTVRAKSESRPRFITLKERENRGSVNHSDQRRALLLPQEVKELGSDKALIFFEGLRPIQCTKIRYYQDPIFRSRLRPPPDHTGRAADSDSLNNEPSTDENLPLENRPAMLDIPSAQNDGGAQPEPAYRDATAADIERLDSLALSDFEADFTQLSFPTTERLSEQDLTAAVDQFLQSLRAH